MRVTLLEHPMRRFCLLLLGLPFVLMTGAGAQQLRRFEFENSRDVAMEIIVDGTSICTNAAPDDDCGVDLLPGPHVLRIRSANGTIEEGAFQITPATKAMVYINSATFGEPGSGQWMLEFVD
jgi:hypothetical protein